MDAETKHTHTHRSRVRRVGVARLGLDVALITVQVEIVRAIDCASKCYTSHLSFFSPTEGQCAIQEKKLLTLTHISKVSHHMWIHLTESLFLYFNLF